MSSRDLPVVGGPIRLLPPELADQIAAGEVVERPASVVKELVDNAVDAGATRIDVELVGAGLERIRVVDDGVGIPQSEVSLALTRHATSKLAKGDDLVEPRCLGFRGEALASIAAVSHVSIETRVATATVGTRLCAHPGLAATLEPGAGPVGTRIEVERLFANVPARRKFLRAPSTEVTHCIEALLRIGLVHPDVALRLSHEGRMVLELPRGSLEDRIERICARRGARLVRSVGGNFDGVEIRAWVATTAVARDRADVTVVVRRRVVRERAMAQIVRAAWGPVLGREPVAWVWVDPPWGTVDVNVHPQKAEVRFSDPQTVYAALRRCFAAEIGPADPVASVVGPHDPGARLPTSLGDARPSGCRAESPAQSELKDRREPGPASLSFDRAEPLGPLPTLAPAVPSAPPPAYALRTRAMDPNYDAVRESWRAQAQALGISTARDARPPVSQVDAVDPALRPKEAQDDEPALLHCLPGPVAIFAQGAELLAVDLRTLRTHLLHRRLVAELGRGNLASQGLLTPVVVHLPSADVALCQAGVADLEGLGLVLEPFGDDAVLVRAVPAELHRCVDELDVAQLVAKVLPYLRTRDRDLGVGAAAALAELAGARVVPRFARKFLREALELGVPIGELPGIRRWDADALMGRP